MWLNCSADLDYNQIYSIKWFKDNQEMYRFITSDQSPTTFYQTNGIVIDVSHLASSRVRLTRFMSVWATRNS